jgi:hypothetical protein
MFRVIRRSLVRAALRTELWAGNRERCAQLSPTNPVTAMSWGQSRSARLMSWKKICCVNQITTRSDDLAENDQSGQNLKLNCAVHDPPHLS